MCFWRLLAWPLRPFFPSLNVELQCSQWTAPSIEVPMVVEAGIAVITEEGEMVVAGDETVRCDDTLGEQSMTVSATLTLLITNVEMIGIGSLPRGTDHRMVTLIGCLNGYHMLPNSLC